MSVISEHNDTIIKKKQKHYLKAVLTAALMKYLGVDSRSMFGKMLQT